MPNRRFSSGACPASTLNFEVSMDFYVVSTELRQPYEPRACRVVRRLRSELTDSLALVEIEPPLPREIYDTTDGVDWLILAPRHEGESLFPVATWPLPVYICRVKNERRPDGDAIASGDLKILDWGEIRQLAR